MKKLPLLVSNPAINSLNRLCNRGDGQVVISPEKSRPDRLSPWDISGSPTKKWMPRTATNTRGNWPKPPTTCMRYCHPRCHEALFHARIAATRTSSGTNSAATSSRTNRRNSIPKPATHELSGISTITAGEAGAQVSLSKLAFVACRS